MFAPTVSPHDPKTAVLTCDMTGQYVTRDGGRSWRMTNLMIHVDTFAFDPIDAHRLYAGANALYATDDFGVSWQMLWPGPEGPRETVLTGDEASAIYRGGKWPERRISALAVDPTNNARLVAGLTGATESDLYLSDDRGRSWRKLATLPGPRVHRLALSPVTPHVVWAVTSTGLFRSEDGGGQWSHVSAMGANRFIGADIGFEADGRTRLYLVAAPQEEGGPAGLYVSETGGASWWFAGAGVQLHSEVRGWGGVPVKAVAAARDHPEIAYLATSASRPGPDGRSLRRIGVAKTTDGGKTWQWSFRAGDLREPELGESDWEGEFGEPANYVPDWLTRSYGSFWCDFPFGFGVSADGSHCYATDMGRAYMTEDSGAAWRGMINQYDDDGGAATTGLDVTTCYGLHFSPHHGELSFISYTDIGLFKSVTRNRTWHHRMAGIPRAWINTCYWLVFDPNVPNKLWSVWSNGHDFPRQKMYRGGKAARFRGGVAVSEDNGETWRPQTEGLPEVGCTHVVLDPTSPAGARTLYVAAHGRGVYKSTNDGATWALRNTGLPKDNLNAWWLSGDPAAAMYLLLSRDLDDQRRGVAGGVYRTTDGAESWTKLNISYEVPFPNDLCVHPGDSNTIYLAAWPVRIGDRVYEGGIYRTADGGTQWKRLPFTGQYVYGLTIDPREPGVLYATAWHDGVFRSEDGGQTWARLGGANFGWPHRVIPDPYDPEKLYLTTFGGSLWHGPKRGTPGAGPDIVDLPPVTGVRP